jgi:hypothetical protein
LGLGGSVQRAALFHFMLISEEQKLLKEINLSDEDFAHLLLLLGLPFFHDGKGQTRVSYENLVKLVTITRLLRATSN